MVPLYSLSIELVTEALEGYLLLMTYFFRAYYLLVFTYFLLLICYYLSLSIRISSSRIRKSGGFSSRKAVVVELVVE